MPAYVWLTLGAMALVLGLALDPASLMPHGVAP